MPMNLIFFPFRVKYLALMKSFFLCKYFLDDNTVHPPPPPRLTFPISLQQFGLTYILLHLNHEI